MKYLFILLFVLGCTTTTTNINTKRLYPLKIEKRKILIPVIIKNQAYSFMLDTGSTASFISEDIAKKLKLQNVGKSKSAGAQRIYQKNNVYFLGKMVIGNVEVDNVKVNGLQTSKYQQYDGVIGRDILNSSKSIYLDLENKRYRFNYLGSLTRNFKYKINKSKAIFVSPTINGYKFDNFIFDTGGGTGSITYIISDKLNLSQDISEKVISVDSTGHEEVSYFLTAETFCIEEMCKNNLTIMPAKWLEKAKYNGLVGYRFMDRRKFAIDFENRLIHY